MNLLKVVVLMLVVLLGAGNAHAIASLSLDDGAGNSVTITDNGSGDSSGVTGLIVFLGSLGGTTVWTVNVTTGITKPVVGSAANPNLDLNSVNVTSTGGGTLQIYFGDQNFTATGTATGLVGGTTQGTVAVSFCADAGNVVGDCSTTTTNLGTFGPGAFSDSASGPIVPGAITLFGTIAHSGAGQVSSFDFNLTKIPEPASMLLVGFGLVGIGIWARSRSRK